MTMVIKRENEDVDQLVKRFFQKLRQERLMTKTRKDGRNRTRFTPWNRKKHKGEW